MKRSGLTSLSAVFAGAIALLTLVSVIQSVFAAGVGSQVIVGNAAPTVSAVSLNGGTAITLTANTTTNIIVNWTVTDANGCGDVIYNGRVTTTIFRSALSSSSCSASNLNCYVTNVTTTNNCPNPTSSQQSANVTTTFAVYYFAQATDASSSYPGETWDAAAFAQDQTGSIHSSDATNVELNTLTAINVTTSTINYGTLAAGQDTGGTNQTATTTNAGNSSTTLQLSGTALVSGSNSIATTSQRYSTSSFTYAGTSTQLTGTPATVSSFFLTTPTSTSNVQQATFWGLSVPGGTATGTYTGTNTFSALFQP